MDKKRKAGSTNPNNTIIIVKKIDKSAQLIHGNFHQIPTESKEKNILSKQKYFFT